MLITLIEGDEQMKIIVTEEGMLWNDQVPALMEYAKDVIVISYYMSEPQNHDSKYKYLDIKIPAMLGMDENGGMTSTRYRALADNCKRQVLSSKKWQLISSIFWQLSTSILYTPTDCSVGIFLLKRKFHFFHSL